MRGAFLEAHKQNLFAGRPAADAPPGARFGELTAATALQILVPLVIELVEAARRARNEARVTANEEALRRQFLERHRDRILLRTGGRLSGGAARLFLAAWVSCGSALGRGL